MEIEEKYLKRKTPAEMEIEDKIDKFLKEMNNILQEKNKKYGNSLHDSKVKLTDIPIDKKILSRIEDKLNRIIQSKEPYEDDILDLIGYLVHYSITKNYLL